MSLRELIKEIFSFLGTILSLTTTFEEISYDFETLHEDKIKKNNINCPHENTIKPF